MKNLLRKLNSMSNQPEVTKDSSKSRRKKMSPDSSSPRSHNQPENKSLSAFTGWFSSMTTKKCSLSEPPNIFKKEERIEQSESPSSSGGLEGASFGAGDCHSGTSICKDTGMNEEYQIHMAMQLSAKEDPEAVQIEAVKQISLGPCSREKDAAQVVAYRYWNDNALTYNDKILDGFYDIYGSITESTSSKMPSLVDLQGMSASEGIDWEVISVNRREDIKLLKLVRKALVMANNTWSKPLLSVSIELVEEIASLVANYMGGPVEDPGSMLRAKKSLIYNLKSTLGTLVLPLGFFTIGLARHRALLFKVLADSVGIPCQLVKGQPYTGSDEVAMNIVKIDDGREYIVDLMSDPGALIPSDGLGTHLEYEESLSSPNFSARDVDSSTLGTSSGEAISSSEESSAFETMHYKIGLKRQLNAKAKPLPGDTSQEWKTDMLSNNPNVKASYSHSHLRSPSWTEGVSTPAMQQRKVKDVSQIVIDAAKNPQFAQKLQDALLESGVFTPPNFFSGLNPAPSDTLAEAKFHLEDKKRTRKKNEPKSSFWPSSPHRGGANIIISTAQQSSGEEKLSVVALHQQSDGDADGNEKKSDGYVEILEGERVSDGSTGIDSEKTGVTFSDDCEIPWEEITLGERIGLGAYGEVYHGDWHGTEVAVKRFLDQDISGEALEEFKSEVLIMKRLRHPNIVLFMGAVTHPPNLSILTEFLPRGSLYRLMHRPNNQLDERRRLRMAFDAARGMSYLHNCSIVHRDLKSPNLLVDRNWVVKVCDFGLSRIKYSTFLSSRSMAGTAEWMAPEVLRNEPSNEKCDVYSFGVILWELCTLQEPWKGMNPMQVVGAVGFQHRRLDIPDHVDPLIADIIKKCWETDPRLRPSFAEIMIALKPFQKPVTAAQVPRHSTS